MTRILAVLLGLSLGLATLPGPVAAQESDAATIVDISQWERARAGRDGVEIARGDDEGTITYEIVESPDVSPDATTDVTPRAPDLPDLSRVPTQPSSGDTTLVPLSGEPASAPVDANPEAGSIGDATMAGPADETAVSVPTCADFGTWYDAQVYYESAGRTAAPADVVSSLDPNGDGVACEELMAF